MSLSVNDILLSPVVATAMAGTFTGLSVIIVQSIRILRRLSALEDKHARLARVTRLMNGRMAVLLSHYRVNHSDYREPVEMIQVDDL